MHLLISTTKKSFGVELNTVFIESNLTGEKKSSSMRPKICYISVFVFYLKPIILFENKLCV